MTTEFTTANSKCKFFYVELIIVLVKGFAYSCENIIKVEDNCEDFSQRR